MIPVKKKLSKFFGKKKQTIFFSINFLQNNSSTMSKISMSVLKEMRSTEFNDEKQKKIEARKMELTSKMDGLLQKYFDPTDEYSVYSSIQRAVKRSSTDAKEIEFYMNFTKEDFFHWHKFVPYKADENGFNLNAKYTECCKRFLKYAKDKEYLPDNIQFDVWTNKKFTVKFTIKNI